METIDFESQSRLWANELGTLCGKQTDPDAQSRIVAIGDQIDNIFGKKGLADVLAMLDAAHQDIVKPLWADKL